MYLCLFLHNIFWCMIILSKENTTVHLVKLHINTYISILVVVLLFMNIKNVLVLAYLFKKYIVNYTYSKTLWWTLTHGVTVIYFGVPDILDTLQTPWSQGIVMWMPLNNIRGTCLNVSDIMIIGWNDNKNVG